MMFAKKPLPDTDGLYHLSTISGGTWVRVCKITGGRQMVHTLAQSSIFHGSHMHVLRNDWGRIIVLVEDRRIALNRDVAYKVMVCYGDAADQAS